MRPILRLSGFPRSDDGNSVRACFRAKGKGEMKSEVENLLAETQWNDERRRLREIVLSCGLDEAVKWGKLCYAFEGRNVAIIFGLKSYCAIGFFKGALLSDDENILVSPGEYSQAMRQLRFSSLDEIADNETTIVRYVEEAIQIEKDGREIEFAEKDALSYPGELADAFADDPGFAAAFENLTPGRRRGYVIHFTGAKQPKTRISRIEKCKPKILAGKGLNDR